MITYTLLVCFLAVGLALIDEARQVPVRIHGGACWFCGCPTDRTYHGRGSCSTACDWEIDSHYD